MITRRLLTALAAVLPVAASLLTVPAAQAQEYPNKPIRIVVGFAPGGGNDVSARLLASKLGPLLGVPITVENRPGAGGHVGAGLVAKADPDGYTLFFTTAGVICIVPHFRKEMTFHPINDFEYISFMSDYHNVIITHPGMGVKDMKGFVDKVKAEPGKYNASTAGLGALQHIYFIVQNDLLGLKMEFINYNGQAPANNSVMSKDTAVGFSSVGTARSMIESGQVIPLAVASAQRSSLVPNVPTLAEAGYPEVLKSGLWGGRQFVMAPKGTPRPIIDKLNAAISKALKEPDMTAKLAELGLQDISNMAPEKVRDEVRTEYETWGGLIKKYDIKDQ
jgi:tripartite-type tricarboxylate transporter receptor subunit TctC